jgi:hypothetical protein
MDRLPVEEPRDDGRSFLDRWADPFKAQSVEKSVFRRKITGLELGHFL